MSNHEPFDPQANLARDNEPEVGLTPKRWQRMKELFGAALQLEPAERSAFVRDACEGDESLHAEIESLLAAQLCRAPAVK